MIYDNIVSISVGKNRKETSWKNKDVLWSELVNKFSKTHRTAETYKDYIAAERPRQAEIKDIGGFVGGHIVGGRRKKGKVLYRSLITLDIDFPKSDIWDDFKMLYSNAAVVYTTHKHSPENPRYRLIIPLDRQVMPDEHEAIARKVAGVLGIESFTDETTFQDERLMYWPSTSKDGVYFSDYQDGPWLCADQILRTYVNWKDCIEWPTNKSSIDKVRSKILKQGDPTEKKGLIGAFCREYNIHEVIEKYLSDVYEPAEVEGRYTYLHGSTASGLVTYDDLYAYSHHGTDPASNILCNAFDLVRIHKFGLQDEDKDARTPTNKLPSYKAMLDYAGSDTAVRRRISVERLQDAQGDFEQIVEDENIDLTWLDKLEVDRDGDKKQTIFNAITVLENDHRLKGAFAYDSFANRRVITKNLPWREVNSENRYIKDEDEAALRLYLERNYELTSRLCIKDALDAYVFKNSFHPVRQYLDGLEWDGEERVDRLLIKYFGAEDNDYTHAVTRKTLTAAVARIYEPGKKFDYTLTLPGEEGKGKSEFVRRLGGIWFSESFTTIVGKEAYEQIQGFWLIEMGEMSALKRAEIFQVKQFLSKQEDSFRPAYGRNVVHAKRQCIFIANTNERDFLRGVDGNRRFWIVDINECVPEADIFAENSLRGYERDQVWAEAKFYYENGEKLYLDKEMEQVAKIEQKAHTEHDERQGAVMEFLDIKIPEDWDKYGVRQRYYYFQDPEQIEEKGVILRDKICAAEIWVECLGKDLKDMTPFNVRPVHDIMRNITTWKPHKSNKTRFGIYGLQKAYLRVTKMENLLKTNVK